ncbi:asparagine synthase (glutamine-hydrolyzing) [Flavobacterium sp.]|jgi:asparagine synthase (glutamine-hydrolysing)|uniref:asparagine synthase (glutamine-hydrolyzing) n=1 Tax=Flavobacterium sp. TaxID=239 RepID=UPI002A810C84|nr:asparagine synthase (glutamine-hydrolyzing) [Flavobacterium sp.]
MCAVNGIIKWNGITNQDQDKVAASLKEMEYRGPDFSNLYSDSNCILGHNRLAILDLNPRSNQPMFSDCGRYTIVFNGEIYNYKTIKSDLILKGYQFNSVSDTEVILKGFIEYGKDIVCQLRGMFALVIWDKELKEAFVARDRFGEKPFYYYNLNETFAFASNLGGIVPLVEGDLQISQQAIYELLSQQYIDVESCIYEGIKKLAAGCAMTINASGIKIKPYWSPDYKEKKELSFEENKKQLHQLISASVEEQLEADVPVGLFLSGGTDSAVIAALASKQKENITALTMSVPGNKDSDEAAAAAFVAEKLKLKHKIVSLDTNCVADLPFVLQNIEPLADASLLPTLAIAKEARKEFTVMLSGDGGDEIFGGYKRPLQYEENPFFGNFLTRNLVQLIIKKSDIQPFQFVHNKITDARIFKWAGVETLYHLKSLPHKQTQRLFKTPQTFENVLVKKYKEASFFANSEQDKMLYVGVKSSLTDDFLLKMDTANMFHSVESRCPFLDHRIIEYTSKMTTDQLMPNGIDKELLKSIGSEYIPADFFKLPKKGFSIPYYEYLKTSWGDVLIRFMKEGISDEMNLIHTDSVLHLINGYKISPTFKTGKILYSILVFEIWLRVFHLKMDPESIKLI